MDVIISIIILIVAVIIFAALGFLYQGEEKIKFLVEQSSPFKLEKMTERDVWFSCTIPVMNHSSQDGIIMDAFPRVLLPYEQYDKVEMRGLLYNEKFPREDGYWEAYILPKEKSINTVLVLKLSAREGNIIDALQEMVDVPVEIYYQTVGRGSFSIKKSRIMLMKEDVVRELGGKVQWQN